MVMTKEKFIEIIDSNLFPLIIVSLISADNIVDVSTCETALEQVVEFERVVSDLTDKELSREDVQSAIKYIEDSKKIIERDLETFKKDKL